MNSSEIKSEKNYLKMWKKLKEIILMKKEI